MVERCKECGANLAMVGIRHRCVQRNTPSAAVEQRSARQSHKLEVEGSNPSPATKSRAKATKGKIRTAGQDKDASRKTKVNPPDGVVSRLGAGRTAQDAAASSGAGRVAIQAPKRGRPKIIGPRPWEAEGISRAQWYRNQAEKRSDK